MATTAISRNNSFCTSPPIKLLPICDNSPWKSPLRMFNSSNLSTLLDQSTRANADAPNNSYRLLSAEAARLQECERRRYKYLLEHLADADASEDAGAPSSRASWTDGTPASSALSGRAATDPLLPGPLPAKRLKLSVVTSKFRHRRFLSSGSERLQHSFRTPPLLSPPSGAHQLTSPAASSIDNADINIERQTTAAQLEPCSPSDSRSQPPSAACDDTESPALQNYWQERAKCSCRDPEWLDRVTSSFRSELDSLTVSMRNQLWIADEQKDWRSEEERQRQVRCRERAKLSATPFAFPIFFGPPPEPEVDEYPELSPEMERRIDEALNPRRPASEVLIDKFRLRLTREDIRTLHGLNWLNDAVINFYLNLVVERGESSNKKLPSVYTMNTFFYSKVAKEGYGTVKRWTRKVDLFSYDCLLMPVHLGVHWCMAVVNFKRKTIIYFDSMGGNGKNAINVIRNYLNEESKDKRQCDMDFSDWSFSAPTDIPQQMNGSDCGVFACKFADYSARERPISFSQDDMPYFRRRMVYELVEGRLLV